MVLKLTSIKKPDDSIIHAKEMEIEDLLS